MKDDHTIVRMYAKHVCFLYKLYIHIFMCVYLWTCPTKHITDTTYYKCPSLLNSQSTAHTHTLSPSNCLQILPNITTHLYTFKFGLYPSHWTDSSRVYLLFIQYRTFNRSTTLAHKIQRNVYALLSVYSTPHLYTNLLYTFQMTWTQWHIHERISKYILKYKQAVRVVWKIWSIHTTYTG